MQDTAKLREAVEALLDDASAQDGWDALSSMVMGVAEQVRGAILAVDIAERLNEPHLAEDLYASATRDLWRLARRCAIR